MISKLGSKKMGHHIIVSVLGLTVFFHIWLHAANSFGAQDDDAYPNRAITMVVPFGPGGAADLASRVIATGLSRELKVPVTIENKAGAQGMLGPAAVLKARPDGYTILSTSDASMIAAPLTAPNVPYDSAKDFLAVGSYGSFGFAYTVKASSPWKTFEDMIKAAKENPGKLSCGFTNPTSPGGFSTALLKKEAGIDFKIILGKETGAVVAMLLGGHIDMLCMGSTAMLPYVKSGEMRFLTVSDQVPGYSFRTIGEAGYPKNMSVSTTFLAVHVSAKTSKASYKKLISALERITKQPETVKAMHNVGMELSYKNPAEYTDLLKAKWDVTAELVKELNLKR